MNGSSSKLSSEERTARYEKEAADTRKENLETQSKLEKERSARIELEKKFAWRELTAYQKFTLTAQLSKSPSSINIAPISNDQESLSYAQQIANIFAAARWKVHGYTTSYPGTQVFDVIIFPAQNAETDFVKDAFTSDGVSFLERDLGQSPMSFGSRDESLPVTLIVGSKERFR